MVEKKFNAAIYCRVSTTGKGQTLGQQEKPLVELCIREGWNYQLFYEHTSGAKETRPELDKMMAAIRHRNFDIVMVSKIDRLGRSLKHLLQLIEEFRNLNTRFICLNLNVDTSTAQGRFFFQIMGAAAEFERELIRERITDKLDYYKDELSKNGSIITQSGKEITSLGRPKGSKDKKRRTKSGYYIRWAKKDTPINNEVSSTL